MPSGSRCVNDTPLTPGQQSLVAEHFKWAVSIAGHFARTHATLRDEFVSAAALGLVSAARSFEPARGLKFKTHAQNRIRGAIADAIRDARPNGLRRKRQRELAGERGGASVQMFSQFDERYRGPVKFIGSRRDPAPPETRVLDRERPEWDGVLAEDNFRALLAGLTVKQKAVVRLVYLRGLLLKEAGERLGLSESRASQLHGLAIAALRERFAAMGYRVSDAPVGVVACLGARLRPGTGKAVTA